MGCMRLNRVFQPTRKPLYLLQIIQTNMHVADHEAFGRHVLLGGRYTNKVHFYMEQNFQYGPFWKGCNKSVFKKTDKR